MDQSPNNRPLLRDSLRPKKERFPGERRFNVSCKITHGSKLKFI